MGIKKKKLCGQIVLWTKLWIQTYGQVKSLWANCLWANSHSILNCKIHRQKKTNFVGKLFMGEIPIPSRIWKLMLSLITYGQIAFHSKTCYLMGKFSFYSETSLHNPQLTEWRQSLHNAPKRRCETGSMQHVAWYMVRWTVVEPVVQKAGKVLCQGMVERFTANCRGPSPVCTDHVRL